MLVADAHELCGHGGINKIASYLAKHFYIPDLYFLLKEVKKNCVVCNTAHPSFIPSPMLAPCELELAPFIVYSIDLIPDMRIIVDGNS